MTEYSERQIRQHTIRVDSMRISILYLSGFVVATKTKPDQTKQKKPLKGERKYVKISDKTGQI